MYMENSFETIEFVTEDGVTCNLKHLVNESTKPRGPVILVHGAGVRANIFNPPTEKNLVRMLAEEGYDVWLENWRASIDLEPRQWDLDQAALYDHPAAVKKVCQIAGTKEIKAIIHCQGSTSFMISSVLGLVPEVKVIVNNAVSLHPVVPKLSVIKLN
jgi:poly(3-hydroxyalkanoate) synthetase